MIDLSSKHTFYIIAAFIFTASLLTILTLWVLQADRKARKKLQKKESVEIIFHHSLNYGSKTHQKKDMKQSVLETSEQEKHHQESLM